MGPRRARSRASSSAPHRFLNTTTREHYAVIQKKGVVQERGINFPDIAFVPRMRQIAERYGWMNFNDMIGLCNMSLVEEFYANASAYEENDYTSYV
jgi:hypothetical protein